MRVLIVEDDRKLAGLLQRGLTEAGMVCDVCHRGVQRGSLTAAPLDVTIDVAQLLAP